MARLQLLPRNVSEAERLVRMLLEKDGASKGCVMAMLTPSDALPFITYTEAIPGELLAEDGRETRLTPAPWVEMSISKS